MRFIFKTDYDQDIRLAKHGGQVFWYSALLLFMLAAPWLLPEYWGQGIMRTALPLWLPGAFKRLALHSVVAHVEPENTASSKLLASAGFTHEGLLRDCSKRGSRYVSLQRYSLLVDELPPL